MVHIEIGWGDEQNPYCVQITNPGAVPDVGELVRITDSEVTRATPLLRVRARRFDWIRTDLHVQLWCEPQSV